ncbi:DUF3515 domain-containing protein [Streptomyces radicis]|uniref:DUF3515 domain-containing protein n=1 Tax=Streptomyces radicis TaxID=1750517 RepID=A0A3A9W046_9ACTN|nr:DUF3515 domain-containing protein [Streptomyces radicis]RKN06631.1 DUF3515 domain-containing protein [Streptomyces radicis]RKN19256.1 DUF3515 domain-containing protein [Streptomyces radicis]
MAPTVRRALPAASALLALAACASAGADAPDVAVPAPTGDAAEACRELSADLPERVDGAERGELPESTPFAMVWGDPAIVLRCGVESPGPLTPGSDAYDPVSAEIVGVNEVSWLLERQDGGVRFTTTERTVFVEMTVPDAYAPEVNPLLDVAAAIDAHIPPDPLYAEDAGDADGGDPHAGHGG